MRNLLCHGRHRGGVLRNHRGGVPRDVRGDEAVPIRILLEVAQIAGRMAVDPTGGERLRHDHGLVVAAGEKREERLRGRAPVVAAGEKREEHLRGRVPVVAENERVVVEQGRVRGHAPVVAEGDSVDQHGQARQGGWEDCPIRLVRMPRGTLVRRR